MPDYSAHDMLAPADALATYLRTVAGLSEITILVGRQMDLAYEIDQAVGLNAGAAVLISLEDWDDLIAEGSLVHLDLAYKVSIWTTPLLNDTGVPESVILGLLVAAVHRYVPDEEDPDTYWRTSGGGYVKHPEHRVYAFPAQIETTLPPVTLIDPAP